MRNIYLIGLLLYCSILTAQSKLDLSKYPTPKNVAEKFMFIQDENNFSPSTNLRDRYWIVFSDRDNNKTYKTSSIRRRKMVINFMDAFFVCAEDGDYIALVRDKLDEGHFSENAEFCGWIHKKYLILSQNSLKNEHFIFRKGMIINSIHHFDDIANQKLLDKLSLKSGPSDDYAHFAQINVFSVFFTLKTNKITNNGKESYYLLSRGSRLKHSLDTQEMSKINRKIVIGWLQKSSYTAWDHRIALEPNWEYEAVKERQDNGWKAHVFNGELNVEKYLNGNSNYETLTKNDPYFNCNLTNMDAKDLEEKRPPGSIFRFPRLQVQDIGNFDGTAYQVGFIGDVITEDLKKIHNRDESLAKKEIINLQSHLKKINIVFVVDATNSMRPYLKAVSDAIGNSVDNLKKWKNVHIGGVIYRDEGDSVPEPLTLTDDFTKVKQYFNRKGQSNKSRYPENMYKGLFEGITKTGLNKYNRNFIILISDVGDFRGNDDRWIDKIVRRLNYYNCNFLACQVACKQSTNSEKNANYDFLFNNSKIMRKAVQKSKRKNGEETKLIPGPNKFSDNIIQYEGGLICTKIIPTLSKKINAITFSKNITDFISDVYTQNNQLIDYFEKIKGGNGSIEFQVTDDNKPGDMSLDLNVSELAYRFLEDALNRNNSSGQIDVNDFITKIKDVERFQLYITGPCIYSMSNSENHFFKDVLFITLSDLRGLVTKFVSAYDDVAIGNADNIRIANAWVEYIGKLMGNFTPSERKKLNKSSINSRTLGELSEMAFGLKNESEFSNISIQEILDLDSERDQAKIMSLKNHIENKVEGLNAILNEGTNSKYALQISDKMPWFIWLSSDMLP